MIVCRASSRPTVRHRRTELAGSTSVLPFVMQCSVHDSPDGVELNTFVLEQRSLHLQSALIPAESAVRSNGAMAWHDPPTSELRRGEKSPTGGQDMEL